ncbi:peptidyl-dipeptidase Dcp [Parafilimonas terrae]|uniref:Dipeptidyl carboxypeptidase n=1 Tax=Parafilimonas terrae TaxID=1465490 RepID=A0A1I5VXH8_9BACT|nr:peptidyl-dipeptidase Dcp [Parafilimonas terrae]SFQ12140.1 peptidyl-dipeptidase Dcp [Parafilimonas terrae]
MKYIAVLFFACISAALISFKNNSDVNMNIKNDLPASNPFSSASTLPFQAPPFDKIKNEDYEPALREGIKQQLNEIEAIAGNTAAPTFENTFVALEKSGALLRRVNNAFNAVTGANTNDTLQQLQETIAPELSAVHDEMYLNDKLFNRVKTIYENRNNLKLDKESGRLVEYYYQQFVLAGAKLSAVDKEQMKKLNAEEATLTAKFVNQLVNAAKEGALHVEDAAALTGLPQSDKDAFAQDAAAKNMNGWLIPLQNTTQQPALQSLSNRTAREQLFKASWIRAERSDSNDTRAGIIRIAAIRAKKAKLMGFENYAAWKLQDQMAQTPQAVNKFLNALVPAVTGKAKQEAADIQALIDAQNGGFQLQPYDWEFYAEQVRKTKYDLDESEIKPYFELNTVLEKGVFYAANQLYGLTFKERNDIPVYQPDVRVFEVFDKNGKSLALFYCDYFKRDNKSGGAWMSNLVDQSFLLKTKPVIYNVCNFTKPALGQPALISFDDVTTMFHEFGHALHGMFAHQNYPSLSGTNVARDYVEFPSQFNEHWALDAKVLNNYALHYKTGQPIPQQLVDKIKKASSFNQGYALTEAIAAAALDMQWHTLPADTIITDADAFEKNALHVTGLDLPQVPPRYRSSYFLHIWGNGYAAGYYAYQWTKMLEEDAYSWFTENGGLTRANGQRFRDMILSRGNTENYNKMFKDFRGHEPDIKAMERELGLPVN